MNDEISALVVDDNIANCRLAAAMLTRCGCQADEVNGGEQALALLRRGNYRLVLLDISMPGMSGTEVCREIRNDARLKGLYVVAYTAHAHEDERAAIVASGFDNLLIKPISLKNVQQLVATL